MSEITPEDPELCTGEDWLQNSASIQNLLIQNDLLRKQLETLSNEFDKSTKKIEDLARIVDSYRGLA